MAAQLLLLLGIAAAPRCGRPMFGTPLTARLGMALMATGALLTVWGGRTLGRQLTALPEPVAHAELIETGIYRHVRHPIYGGLLLLALGWSVRRGSGLALGLTAGLLALLQAKAQYEERALRARFPQYAGYARRVRRFFPGLY
ncbi:methyltransferase family protein [Deinococcus aerophilus]|uniref:Isoprenylcysteine carboxylmethyltransferase family protein n=1 Tax=Deinococcus aerophilus TaxID=522488 RepID=A0ABQ2H0J7_9DEIO|nr:isoprenylcysteine carboxylmethyltransferase family protein [Deinococcus aerophilus]GGM21136.1 hypothetical protein GCM10010841_31370 [Deinococcus aerophilus]